MFKQLNNKHSLLKFCVLTREPLYQIVIIFVPWSKEKNVTFELVFLVIIIFVEGIFWGGILPF